MLDKVKIGKQLKELRVSRGWRQLEVADKVGLSRSAISNIEAGKRALTLSTLQRFCEVYKIDISYFGIETKNFDENLDLITRLEKIFKSNDIPKEKKEEIYRDIMRIYLDNIE
jgi:transcriptional regulator with XRE-family HTH domain